MINRLQRLMLLLWLGAFGTMLSPVSAEVLVPKYSTATSEYWYLIKFTAGGCYLTGEGENQTMTIQEKTGSDHQVWKLVEDGTHFHLVNKAGYYATVKDGVWEEHNNTCPLQEVSTKPKKGFYLISGTSSYQIESLFLKTSNASYYLNTWGGTGAGTPIGMWNKINDPNNYLVFEEYSAPESDYRPKDKLTLWYTSPAKDNGVSDPWMEYSLPIGNGQLGASVFGGLISDEIIFNEKTLWTGTSTSEGTESNSNEYGSYQVFGSIHIQDNNAPKNVQNYIRELNLTNATASMKYSFGGVDYKREYIVSYPDKVIAVHLTASQPTINIQVMLNPKMSKGYGAVEYSQEGRVGTAHFDGKLDVVSFAANMKVLIGEEGNITKVSTDLMSDSYLKITNAKEVTVLLAAGTDFDNAKANFITGTTAWATELENRVSQAAAKKWNAIYAAHTADYQNYFDRVRLDLSGSVNDRPTNKLVDDYRGGQASNDLMLEELYFNYGRYLEIASSRGVALPSNLQGIWANNNKSAWNADIHANINVQMNYWPAEPTNLSDMHKPFLDYIIRMAKSEPWKRYAAEANQNYAAEANQKRGWTCYTENNIFGGVGVWMHNYVVENAWYCSHLWQHYCYTLNKDFLREAFPAMLSATQFWLDRLILYNGQYLCPNEYSPEHGPTENGVAHAQQLVWELFDNTLKAIDVLGETVISQKDLNDLRDKFSKMDKGLATEEGPGGTKLLREWKYSDYTAGDVGHRHLSHLMCLYPFSQVKPGTELFNAAVNSLNHRGDTSTGWSMGWKINLWARALDGNHAHNLIKMALRHSESYDFNENAGGIYYNLFDSHAPFQIDGNFGACAGMAEMLFQSHSGVLHFLPALPDVWSKGTVSGLKGIGDFTVSVTWEGNRATRITIRNNKGEQCFVKCQRGQKPVPQALVTVDGVEVTPVEQTDKSYFIPSNAGQDIVIDFTQSSSGEPQPDQSGTCGTQLEWKLNTTSGELNITGSGVMTDYSAEHPAPWNDYAGMIKKIVLPEGITAIGNQAFVQCDQVKEQLFTDNVIKIGKEAFSSQTKVKLLIDDALYQDKSFALTPNTYHQIVYERPLASDSWGTVILPFAPDVSSSRAYDFFRLSAVGTDAVTFKYVSAPEANVPYLLRAAGGGIAERMTSDVSTIVPSATDVVVPGWKMIGSFVPFEVAQEHKSVTYVLWKGKIMTSSVSIKVRPFRAYFNGPEYAVSGASRSMRIMIEDQNGEVADITDVIMDEARRHGPIYDLAGRQVLKPVSGHIYIQNGQKFIAQ